MDQNLVKRIISILFITILLILNILSSINTIHIGDFLGNHVHGYPPPYRTNTEIIIYDLEKNTVEHIVYNGFPLSIEGDLKYKVVSIYVSGIDLFILLYSITVIVLLYFSNKLFNEYALKYYYVIIALILVSITMTYLYILVNNTSISNGEYLELTKPLYCETIVDRKLCVLDMFNDSSIIYIHVNSTVELVTIKNGVVEKLSIKNNYLSRITAKKNVRIGISYPVNQKITLIYRRVSFHENRIEPIRYYLVPVTIFILALAIVSMMYFSYRSRGS